MKYKDNWEETRERFKAWWNRSSIGRPLLWVTAAKRVPSEEPEPVAPPSNPRDLYMDVEYLTKLYRNYCRTHSFMADSFPFIDLNLGAGSMALYLGSEPNFAWDTVWFKECISDIESHGPLRYDEENFWWNAHLEILKRAKDLAGGDFLVAVPDIVEGIDILSAMMGPQNLCYSLMDHPDLVKRYLEQLDDLYFNYFDPIYDIVRDSEGNSYTAFKIWGPGRTAKVQCDFSALISPGQFREFVLPSLRRQCRELDFSLYHLDGPDAIKHLDALMEIDELDALQWTPGAGNPGMTSEIWYPIYDKVRDAGKSLWIWVDGYNIDDYIANSAKIVKRYGSDGLYLLYGDLDEEDAVKLIKKAEKGWR